MFQNKQMYRNHLKYFENLKTELEARASKIGNLSYRQKIKQQQDKENYLTEIHRIRGILSTNDNRLPIGTTERLQNRRKEIENLKYGAFPSD